MTITVSPATIFDLADLSGAMSRRQWLVTRELAKTGDMLAVKVGDRLVALGCFSPLDPEGITAEATFNPSSVDAANLARADRHMLGIVRAIRLTLETSPYSAIVTETRSEAGRRLARLVGFNPSGVLGSFGEIWAYGHLDRRGRPEPGEGTAAAIRAVSGQPDPLAGADGGRAGGARPGGL